MGVENAENDPLIQENHIYRLIPECTHFIYYFIIFGSEEWNFCIIDLHLSLVYALSRICRLITVIRLAIFEMNSENTSTNHCSSSLNKKILLWCAFLKIFENKLQLHMEGTESTYYTDLFPIWEFIKDLWLVKLQQSSL